MHGISTGTQVQMTHPELYKVIFEVRYKPTLTFYDRLMATAELLSEYPHWQTDRLRVIRRDFENHCSLAIQHNSFSYEQDSNSIELEETRIAKALEVLPFNLDIQNCMRLGYRCRYLIPVEFPFEELVAILDVKLLSTHDRLRRILPGTTTDLLYRVDLQEPPYSYHITLGPVCKEEVARHIGFNIEQHLDQEGRAEEYQKILEVYPEVALFVDVDLCRVGDEIPVSEVSTDVELCRSQINTLVEELNTYLFRAQLG